VTEDQDPQEVPPDYTAPIGPEDDSGFVEFSPQEEDGVDLGKTADEQRRS
jgi:hypothetical protein